MLVWLLVFWLCGKLILEILLNTVGMVCLLAVTWQVPSD